MISIKDLDRNESYDELQGAQHGETDSTNYDLTINSHNLSKRLFGRM